jgi:putative hydrolase of HD superfamily
MKNTDNILEGLRIVERLKIVNRQARVGNRYESTSEHSFHAVLIADMLSEFYPSGVDVQKIKDMVLYHDLVEVHAGDVGLVNTQARKSKETEEYQAFQQLLKEIPNPQRYTELFHEYEKRETIESKIAKKIDRIEVLINAINEPRIAKDEGYTEEFLQKHYDEIGGDAGIVDELHKKIISILKDQEKI